MNFDNQKQLFTATPIIVLWFCDLWQLIEPQNIPQTTVPFSSSFDCVLNF